MKKNIFVTKASGKSEPFSILKLRKSLERAKANKPEIDTIISKLLPQLYNGINTKKIYSEAFRLLRQCSPHNAARYQIKKGIMELGPSGFPFEKFISKLFEIQGYSVQTGQFVKGKCVTHEIDVIAKKETEILLAECKYRNTQGITVDVKTPLYIHARFDDVLANGSFKKNEESVKGWVITNAKFTTDAITYGKCVGLNLLSWDYPNKSSLKELIDLYGLYPLTCLTSLSKQEKQWLLTKDYVLAKDVCHNEKLLEKAGVSLKRIDSVKTEGTKLLNGHDTQTA
jgi:hypothetical protein